MCLRNHRGFHLNETNNICLLSEIPVHCIGINILQPISHSSDRIFKSEDNNKDTIR